MTFEETIKTLIDQTEEVIVYAANGYNWINGKNQRCIGIRTTNATHDCYGEDPIIGNITFMICGTIYENGDEITNIVELSKMNDFENVVVRLHASSLIYCNSILIELGGYKVIKAETISAKTDWDLPAVKLTLKRKS